MIFKSPEHRISVIYMITNTVNSKIYIGQAQDFYVRYYQHKKIKGKAALHNAFRKYGFDKFDFSIIERIQDISTIDSREQFWMDFHNSYNNDIGYNICKIAGSTRGRIRNNSEMDGIRNYRVAQIGDKNSFFGKTHSEETKKHLSILATGRKLDTETKQKISDSNKGKKRSDATRQNISTSLKGKKKSESHNRKNSESHKGKILSEEHKSKIRAAMIKYRQNSCMAQPKKMNILNNKITSI